MALWAKVQTLTGDAMRQIQSAYGVHFPLEVRHHFAQWIESQPWAEVDLDNADHEAFACSLRDSLLKMLEERAGDLSSEEMFIVKLKLQETAQQFKEMYGNNPMNLVRVVNNCLMTEQRLVHMSEEMGSDSNQANQHKQIMEQFESLSLCTQETEKDLRALQQEQESFIIQYQESVQINNQISQLQNQPNGATRMENEQRLQTRKRTVDMGLSRKAQELIALRLALADKHHETFKQLTILQTHILDDRLITWKRQQQLAGNGAPFEGSLETLQHWCQSLAELIWQNRQQIKKVELLRTQLPIDIPHGRQDLLPMLNTMITGLLSTLVTSTFIIEKQPPQVLKKDSRFTATVRLLVGGKLNVHMNPPTVKATIINEDQARCLLKSDKNMKNENCGNILNNQGTMEFQQANGQLAVTFRNMALKTIKRAEKKGNETVVEEKFSILFQSQFTVGGGELVFQVWTLSLPVVVTVHGNQECNALATVLWDNAFAEPGRVPFQVPEKVLWPQLCDALNTKFQASCGKGLSIDNMKYLASKLFGQLDDYSGSMVTWQAFYREPLPGRNFTFWEWFYAILKLTKDWLQGPWKDSLVMGFVSKQAAQDVLMRCQRGTFLLRFSDSEIGGITIAWDDDDPQKPGEKQVWNLAPFTDRDLKIRGLGDRMKDLHNLNTLYPNVSKEQAFGKFWSQAPEPSTVGCEGYVKPDLNVVIPGINTHASAPETPKVPQAHLMQPQSPASGYNPPSIHDQQSQDSIYGSRQGDAMDMDLPDFNMTDYTTDDIVHQINVNQLLMQYPEATGSADFGTGASKWP